MSEETRERSFDALARGLSSGTLSRRKALRLMGAALFGGALASIPGVASARPRCTSRFPVTCGTKCCPEEASCVRGRCVCPGGDVACPSPTVQGSFFCCPEGSTCCSVQGFPSFCCPTGTSCGTITDVGGTRPTCHSFPF
jgi:hypothetical protein